MIPTSYVLRGGDAGAQRLRLLAAAKWPSTRWLLERVGVRPGMRCLDVGCGGGDVTVELARLVAPDGEVQGIDMDDAVLEHARSLAAERGARATFRQSDAVGAADAGSFDLVYARFLLTHLSDSAATVRAMRHATRPGGMVVVEDIDFAGHFCRPACPAFERYQELYQAVVRLRGADPCIGPRLPELLLDAGLMDVQVETVTPTFRTGDGKQIAAITLAHIRGPVLAAGLASDGEIDRLIAELEAFARDERTLLSLPRIFQAWGRRPPHD
jgi:SAM-dependent methyltransferase